MTELVVDKQDHVTILTINRPERLNALNSGVLTELTSALKDFEQDPSQYVVILTGAGDKAFCAGSDLKEMAADAASGGALPILTNVDIAGLAASEKVTIAAVNGLAIAAGLELSLCCDIRLASSNASFGSFEVKRGIVAGIAVHLLPRLMPIGAVMDLMLCGKELPAEEALRLGLVQQVVPRDQLLDVALERADMVARNSQSAVRGTKQIIRFWRDSLMAEQQRYYQAVTHRVLLSGDVFEGPKAFVEKREPSFRSTWPDPFDAAR